MGETRTHDLQCSRLSALPLSYRMYTYTCMLCIRLVSLLSQEVCTDELLREAIITLGSFAHGNFKPQLLYVSNSSVCTYIHVSLILEEILNDYVQCTCVYIITCLNNIVVILSCYVCMTCNTPTPGHPSATDDAWYCFLCIG